MIGMIWQADNQLASSAAYNTISLCLDMRFYLGRSNSMVTSYGHLYSSPVHLKLS